VLDTSQPLCQSIRTHLASQYVLDRKLVLVDAVDEAAESHAHVSAVGGEVSGA